MTVSDKLDRLLKNLIKSSVRYMLRERFIK